MPRWTVSVKASVIDDLRALGQAEGRAVLEAATARLAENPEAESRHMKTLRPNPVAQRQLWLRGRYRVLFNSDPATRTVTIVLVGEKRGDALFVQRRRFTTHHEGHPPQ